MEKNITTEASITIEANSSKVWEAIINPVSIRKYLFGTNVISDWEEGSDITYEGSYEGKRYKDKGKILKLMPEEVFQSTYWSSMGGKEDLPENYNTVTYRLKPIKEMTLVTISQDNIRSEQEKEHVTENWKNVLKALKKLVEEQR